MTRDSDFIHEYFDITNRARSPGLRRMSDRSRITANTKDWPVYPKRMFDAVRALSDDQTAAKIFSRNAEALFDLQVPEHGIG